MTFILVGMCLIVIGVILGLAIASIGQAEERKGWEQAVQARDQIIDDLQYRMNLSADLRG